MSVVFQVSDTSVGAGVAVSELISAIEYDSDTKNLHLCFTEHAIQEAKEVNGSHRIGLQLQTSLPQMMPLIALNVPGAKYLNPNEMNMPQTLAGFVSHSYFGMEGDNTYPLFLPVNLNADNTGSLIFNIYIERDIGFGYWSSPQLSHGMCVVNIE